MSTDNSDGTDTKEMKLEEKCTLWTCKCSPTRKGKLLWMTSHSWGNRSTKCHGKYHFTFSFASVLCTRESEFFTEN